MKEYLIKVDFENGNLYCKDCIEVTENDYNSTKLIFEYDKDYSGYIKKFQMQYEQDEESYQDEIHNDEFILVAHKNNELVPLINKSGNYYFNIALYDGDSKLTVTDKLKIMSLRDITNGKDIELDDRVPILDELINDVSDLLQQTNNLNIDAKKVEDTTTITITKKDGSTKSIEVHDGQGGGTVVTPDYEELENKPFVNNVELIGNMSLDDLGIQPKGNYSLKEELPTKTSDLTNDSNFVLDVNYIHTDNNFTNNEKTKLANLQNYDDTQIRNDINEVNHSLSIVVEHIGKLQENKADKILVINESQTTTTLQPNKFYKFGEVESLNLILGEITDNTILNEYMFEFTSGSTATTLTLPNTIKWLETPTIEANKIYQCSIVDNVGLLVGVTNV